MCLCGNVGKELLWLNEGSMNADRPLWLYGPYLYDYHLYYLAHQYVITDY